MRKTKKILLICMALCAMHAKILSQEVDSIIYILPDRIEVKLDSIVTERKKYDEPIFFMLKRVGENEFKIIPGSYRKDENSNSFTNRFVLINKTKYPVTFDYDEFFGTLDTYNIGEFGRREGFIKKRVTIFEGYSLTFDRRGNIIEEDWGIYENK